MLRRKKLHTREELELMIKIKFLLPQGKNVEVKKSGNVVRQMGVRRRAIYSAKARNVRYDRN